MADLLVNLRIKAIDGVTAVAKQVRESIRGIGQAANFGKDLSADTFELAANLNQTGQAVGAVAAGLRGFVDGPRRAFEELENNMARVRARVKGLTDEEFAQLNDAAKEIGRTSLFGANQIAAGFAQLANEGMNAKDQMALMAPAAELALGASLDLGQTLSFVENTLGRYKITAAETVKVTDMIAQAAVSSESSVGELGQALEASSLMASRLGVGIEDSVKLLGALAAQDIKGAAAGASLSGVLRNLASQRGKAGAQAMQSLLGRKVSDEDFKKPVALLGEIGKRLEKYDKTTQMKGLRAIFRQDATAAGALIDAIKTDEFKTLEKNLAESEGAAGRMAQTMKDTGVGASKELEEALHDLDLELGAAIGSSKGIKQAITGVVTSVTKWVKEHPTLTKVLMYSVAAAGILATILSGMIFTIATIVAAWGSYILIAPIVVASWTAITGVATAAAGALGTFFSTMVGGLGTVAAAAAPFLAVAAAIGAIGLALFELQKHWDELDFVEGIKGLADSLSEDGVLGTLKQLFDPTALISDVFGSSDTGDIAAAAAGGGDVGVGGTIKVQVTGPGEVTGVESTGPVGLDVDAGPLLPGGI